MKRQSQRKEDRGALIPDENEVAILRTLAERCQRHDLFREQHDLASAYLDCMADNLRQGSPHLSLEEVEPYHEQLLNKGLTVGTFRKHISLLETRLEKVARLEGHHSVLGLRADPEDPHRYHIHRQVLGTPVAIKSLKILGEGAKGLGIVWGMTGLSSFLATVFLIAFVMLFLSGLAWTIRGFLISLVALTLSIWGWVCVSIERRQLAHLGCGYYLRWWQGILSLDRLWLECPQCAAQGKSVRMRPEWNSHIKQWEMRCKLNQTIHVLLLHLPSLTVRSELSDRDVRGS